MSMAEDFKALKEHNREQREQRRDLATFEIETLTESGHVLERKSDYHFRVDGKVDLFPTNRRYHDLRSGARGFYRDARALLERLGLRG